jgi:predicted CxxxxCH...CXXCH cytochrome family protein
MGKIIKNKKYGIDWWARTGLVLLLTLGTSAFMNQGWYYPVPAQAAPTTTGFTNIRHSAAVLSSTSVGNVTVPTGTNRMLVVAFANQASSSAAMVVNTVTYGGVAMTSAGGNATTSLSMHTQIYYLKDNAVMDGTARPLVVNITGGGTLVMNDVWYAIYTGVDQAATLTIQTYSSGSTAVTSAAFATGLVVPTNGAAAVVAVGARGTAAVSYTKPANFTVSNNQPNSTTGVGLVATSTTAATDTASFAAITGGPRWSQTGIALAAAVVTDSTPPTAGTVTITPDISSTYTSAAPTITTQFTDAQSAVTSCQYTTNGGTNWIAGAVSGAGPYTCTANPMGLTGFLNINMRATSTGGTTTATQIQRTVDATVPTDGTLTVTAGNLQNSISWTTATDTGGGAITSYILRFATGATAPANCASGTAVTGSPFSAAILATTHAGLTNGTQYSYRLCAADSLGNTSGGVTKSATPVAGQVTTITTCGGCHGHPAGPNLLVDANRAASAGTFQGSHTKHVSVAADCAKCHTNPTRMDHSSGAIEVAISAGGTYSKASPITISTSPTLTGGTCSSTTCHGSSSPTWGTSTTNATCTKCHGVSGTSSAQYTADTKTAAPGYVSTAPVGTGRSTSGATAATDTKVGAHDTHLRGLNTISNPVACTECHANVNTSSASFTGHMDGAGSLNFGTLAASGTGTAPSYNATTGTCSNIYCHYGRTTYAAPATANGAVVWNNTAYLTGVDTAAADCGKCHASPPSLTGTHAATPALTIADCTGCHSHVNANGTFNNAALHINGTVEASGDCISCHASIVNSPIAAALNAAVATRPAIVPSFSLASKHTRSRGTAVTNNDCCVCHMEGDVATGSPNAAYHKNGYIELRDPDTGLTIKGVTHSGTTTAAGAYSSTGADAKPVRFSRNLGSATIEADTAAIMINQCLKCHDADGALSTSAQVAGGSALKPFAGTVSANPGGGVLNVAAQFASTNKSFHPVLVRQNSGYTNTGGTRMVTPWNGIAKTATTTTYGPLISCWDCHAPNGSTAATILTSSGIHGGAVNGTDAVPLRGNVYVNAATTAGNLCLNCHVSPTGSNHGTGSAITSSTDGGMTYFGNRCYFCHASDVSRTRPWGAGDAHGYNARGGVIGNNQAFPAVNNGYAFLRSEGWYNGTGVQSIRSIGATTYTPTCGGRVTTGGGAGACSRSSMGGYTPGGVY